MAVDCEEILRELETEQTWDCVYIYINAGVLQFVPSQMESTWGKIHRGYPQVSGSS